jgi:hypothetical protein
MPPMTVARGADASLQSCSSRSLSYTVPVVQKAFPVIPDCFGAIFVIFDLFNVLFVLF